MNKINKNGISNSTGLASSIIKSGSDKENKIKNQSSNKTEELNDKFRKGIERRNAMTRGIKNTPPINRLGMTNKLSDSSVGIKNAPKESPKPLPVLPHSGLNLKVRQTKPLPPVPTKSHTQPQIQSQPQPKIAVLTNTSDVGLIAKQMKLFKKAINSENTSQAELLAEQLNKNVSDDKNISADICCKFAINVEKLARPNFNFTPEIKQALVQFSSAWIAMKSAQGDPKGSAWDVVINTMALSVQKKSKEWGMEF